MSFSRSRTLSSISENLSPLSSIKFSKCSFVAITPTHRLYGGTPSPCRREADAGASEPPWAAGGRLRRLPCPAWRGLADGLGYVFDPCLVLEHKYDLLRQCSWPNTVRTPPRPRPLPAWPPSPRRKNAGWP